VRIGYRQGDTQRNELEENSQAFNVHLACTQGRLPKNRRLTACTAAQEETHMKSLVVKRSIVIAGHKTSVSLEEPFWTGLKEIAHGRQMTLSNMVGDIDTRRRQGNLSSAIRLFVLDSVRTRIPGFAANRPAADLMTQGNQPSHV
jgi:predicted DNA-binding ribbon-helix-helix protein